MDHSLQLQQRAGEAIELICGVKKILESTYQGSSGWNVFGKMQNTLILLERPWNPVSHRIFDSLKDHFSLREYLNNYARGIEKPKRSEIRWFEEAIDLEDIHSIFFRPIREIVVFKVLAPDSRADMSEDTW